MGRWIKIGERAAHPKDLEEETYSEQWKMTIGFLGHLSPTDFCFLQYSSSLILPQRVIYEVQQIVKNISVLKGMHYTLETSLKDFHFFPLPIALD